MDVTPVGAVGSGRGARAAEVARNDDYDREVRIARRFRDAERERRRREQPPPRRAPVQDEADGDQTDDEPRAGAGLDTYL